MFEDHSKNLNMLKGAYKKLKSFYYYDKSLLYIKLKIACFENDNSILESTFEKLASYLEKGDPIYEQSLIKQIDYHVLPKKMTSIQENTHVVSGNVDHTKNVARLNFYIDVPVELLILDALWTLLLGKVQKDNNCKSEHSYAGKLKKSLYIDKIKDLYKGIDFESNRFFEPYFTAYTQWRDNAFLAIKRLQNGSDLLMLNLDLKSFYYSVNFEFDSMYKLLHQDKRLVQFELLTRLFKNVYMQYTNILRGYRKGLSQNTSLCVFPIGLLSPMILRESYLKKFDDLLISKIRPIYYGRYVDDMLIVISANGEASFSQQQFIEKHLIQTQLITPDKGQNYRIIEYPNLRLQKEKINCFFFKQDTPNVLLKIYEEKIRINSSEANLLPDVKILEKSFANRAYDIASISGSNKISDFRFLQSNNYSATRFVNGLKEILKNTTSFPIGLNKSLDQILEFYRDSQGIEFYSSWKSIFELFTLCKDKKRANRFYLNLKDYIAKLNFDYLDKDELIEKKKSQVLKRLKDSMKVTLNIAISLAVSLDYSMAKGQNIRPYAKIFRKSNLLNHNLVTLPLLNFVTFSHIENISLIDIQSAQRIFDGKEKLSLDQHRLEWSPRFIHLEELNYSLFLFSFFEHKKYYKNNYEWLFKKYLEINHIGNWGKITINIKEEPTTSNQNVNLLKLTINREKIFSPKIGLVSTYITEQSAALAITNPSKCLTFLKKKNLYFILNEAKKEQTKYLCFPEFYLPAVWLPEVWSFAKANDITIVTGLQYLKSKNYAFNFTCIIEPFEVTKYYRNVLLLFREKNYYAPEEEVLLAKCHYYIKNCDTPFYYVISENNFSFSTILCFEFTDIYSRAAFKGKIDAIFVPQLNRDTHYFSSIVSSTARDLHCFIIQTNTSKYGDSRITAPYKTEMKNIVQIKGGINDVILVGKIDVDALHRRQSTYTSELLDVINACYNCKKAKYLRKGDCEKCKHKLSMSIIKGIPPNFRR